MKIFTNQMPLHSTSVKDLEVNTVHQHYSITDVDPLKGDLKVFHEDFSNMICHKNNSDPLAVEIKNYTLELPDDHSLVVMESQAEVSFDDPIEMCSSQFRTGLDNNVQSSAHVSGIELEHFVSQKCSRETDGTVLRDIRVDEGVTTNDKILEEDISNGYKCMVEDSSNAKDTKYSMDNVKVEVEWPVPVGLKPMTHEDPNDRGSKILLHQSESNSESTYWVSCDPKEKVLDTFISEDAHAEALDSNMSSKENKCIDEPKILHQDLIAEFGDASDKLSCSAPEDTFKETDIKIDLGQEAVNNLSHQAANNNEVEPSSNMPHHPQMPEEHQNLHSDHLASSARIQRDCLDSSFASVGPPPHTNSIAYSGPVASYSGSLSHRSDASTVSTRSFAFPVLQNEWNFSPVRMQKASRRRHLGRRRGWMNGLFCCKF